MQQSVVPMLHVPDVRATVEWYETVAGFTRVRVNEEDGEMNWALLRYGNADVMLNAGGKASDAWRREVDLYVHSLESVDAVYARLKGEGRCGGGAARHGLWDAGVDCAGLQSVLDYVWGAGKGLRWVFALCAIRTRDKAA